MGLASHSELKDTELIGSLRLDISSQLSVHQIYLEANSAGIEKSILIGLELISMSQQAAILNDRNRINNGLVAVNTISSELEDCFDVRPLGILQVRTSEIKRNFYPSRDYSHHCYDDFIY